MEADRSIWWWVAGMLAALAAAVAGYWYLTRPPAVTPPPPAVKAEPAPPPAPAEPAIEHPVEAVKQEAPPPPAPLPALADSDASLLSAISNLIGAQRAQGWIYPDGIVRRFVATIDNLPREKAAPRLMPVKPVGGPISVTGPGEALAIAPDNAARYSAYVQVLERVDAKQLAGIYLRYYPWFQQAYEELGYPKGYFNDRLVAVIDHLLAAPEPSGPILLTQPKVLYQYLDPQLEALSAGQKTLVRMGPDNARRVKAKLRELRREITASPAK
jgi:hypothetical protein